MSELQEKRLAKLRDLLSRNLSYIYGERESGPNGAKADFLKTGRVFLRQLAKDLKLDEFKVTANPAGIAYSGEVMLYGMWCANQGVMLELLQFSNGPGVALYRTISGMKDYRGGENHLVTFSEFKTMNYERLVRKIRKILPEGRENYAAGAAA